MLPIVWGIFSFSGTKLGCGDPKKSKIAAALEEFLINSNPWKTQQMSNFVHFVKELAAFCLALPPLTDTLFAGQWCHGHPGIGCFAHMLTGLLDKLSRSQSARSKWTCMWRFDSDHQCALQRWSPVALTPGVACFNSLRSNGHLPVLLVVAYLTQVPRSVSRLIPINRCGISG